MEYRRIGRSGLKASVIGLGCNNFGLRIDYKSSSSVIHKALDLGITFFDTADRYGKGGLSEKYLGKALGAYHPLLLHSHEGFLFQTKEPVLKIADLKGMKLRAASRGGVWLLESLGAVGVGMPLPRIPAALSKGVIDGVTLPFEIAPAVKTQDLVNHFSTLAGAQPRLGTNVFTFLMNKASYDKLPPDLQKVLDDNSGRAIAKAAGQNWRDIETPGRNVVASKDKNKFHVIPAAEVDKMKAASQPVFDRWYEEVGKRGLDGPTMVIDALDMIEKHSGNS